MKIYSKLISLLFAIIILASCEGILEEEVFQQLGPSNFYKTELDAIALLNAVYESSQRQGDQSARLLLANELNTDIMYDEGGGLEAILKPFENFTWNSTEPYLIENIWNEEYETITRANLVIDKVPNIPIAENIKTQIVAEARFLRALSYFYLEDLYGPVPLVISSDQSPDAQPARASQQEMDDFIITELSETADILPVAQELYGRATKGAALAMLMRFQLNNKNWQEVVNLSSDIMELGVYSLFESENRTDLFKIENEQNSEFICARTYLPGVDMGMIFLPRAAPPQYQYKFG